MQIDCDFPGGNIVVDQIEGDRVFLHQDLRDTEGDWFYWAFRVRDLNPTVGQTITFQFPRKRVIGTRGPCVSLDGGHNWSWLASADENLNRFTYAFPPGVEEVRFSQNWPYLHADLDRFLEEFEFHPNLRRETLCRDRSGRAVDRLVIGCLDRKPRYRLLLTARHHCCESTPNFVLEGLITRILRPGANNNTADWFQKNVQIWVIPFVDADGVEAGDQGKNRRPHDHNRDYAPTAGLYPTTRALREQVPDWLDGAPFVDLDLHCPHIRGEWNEHIYFVGLNNADNWTRVQQLAGLLEKNNHSGLEFSAAKNLPFGQSWNTHNDPARLTHAGWAHSLPRCKLASSVEIPYANVGATTLTPDLARNFGTVLLNGLREFFPA